MELIPAAGGLAAGTAIYACASAQRRLPWSIAVSVVIGLCASAISGELAASFGFVLVDTSLAFVCCVVAAAACRFGASSGHARKALDARRSGALDRAS